ncbi:MAG: TVP38/TMEM64 family protein [Clostridiales bacterium]|jgi:uncharacterized membrane protein YdjX (TVP38/TMEM64 family)|nr:TVP38/TMEM64 family protein [Clostridiales bacterium]
MKKITVKKAALTAYTLWCAALLALTAAFLSHMPLWAQFAAYILVMLLLLGAFLSAAFKKPALFKLCVTTTVSVSLILGFYIILDLAGVFDTLTNLELIKNFVLSTGHWGMIALVGLKIAQVVFLPIPGVLIDLAGVALYGPWVGFALSMTGTSIGSVIAFSVGKVFGKKVVSWIVGKEQSEKYRKTFDKKGRFVFILMLVFPIFPDDLLCMVAGVTTMSYGYFIAVMLLTRPWGLAATCFLGSGEVIPFRGWGLAAWAAILLAFGAAFFFLNKYKDRIGARISQGFGKKKGEAQRAKIAGGAQSAKNADADKAEKKERVGGLSFGKRELAFEASEELTTGPKSGTIQARPQGKPARPKKS